MDADRDISMSVSVTTRKARPGEEDGRDYIFVDEAAFKRMAEGGELLEWARVFDNYYGTPRAPVEAAIAKGKDVLFDIDWQGAQQLSEKMKHDVVRVFILPPSAASLEERLRARAQDPEDVVRRRMDQASAEISHWPEYDYVIVNTDLPTSMEGLTAILAAERLRRERLNGLTAFVRGMQAKTMMRQRAALFAALFLVIPVQPGAGDPLGDVGSHEIIAAKPGTILRVWPQVGGSVENATAYRILYRSTGLERRAYRRLRRGAVSRRSEPAREARRHRLGAPDHGRRREVRADAAAGSVGHHRRHRGHARSRLRHCRH